MRPELMVPPPPVSSASQMRLPAASVASTLVPLQPVTFCSWSPPASVLMPYAKVEVAELEVMLSRDDSIPPENVDVEVLVTTRLVTDEVPAFSEPPVMVSPFARVSPVPLIPPLNEDVAVVVTFTAPVINASPFTESRDVGDDVAIPRLPARSTMSAAVDDP